ncbi:MAG: CinA family protein [Polynucleobacter sp.]
MTSSCTQDLVSQLASALLKKQWHLSTAESCTGGLVAAAITELAGSSEWFERGYVTYSNSAKSEDINVSQELIAQHGAVSDQVARAMAIGAKQSSNSDIALSITGIAGPTGGSVEKPVGTVCFAWILANNAIYSETKLFSGNRRDIRAQACEFSLKRLLELLLIK